ncbi:MAG: MiaB/RimO family radical SAM methylthiotransferase [Anaerolineae bacterium]|nr:MiaB/RimO family radical SAM methylthiotransferase [Anaerolineae bacterium]
MQTFYLWTIGCQMNFADSWRLEEELRRLGYRQAPQAEQADLVVLNTCVVRQNAEDKCVGRMTSLKGWKERHPDRVLAVMGCFVGDESALQEAYPYVDLFVKPSDYMGLVHYVCDHDLLPENHADLSVDIPVSMHVPISYGCDHHCTYCIVRIRRGRERSRPVTEIVDEIARLVGRGVREVTLLGQNVDSYGRDLSPSRSLADLLHAVHEIDGLARIRFLTSHPADMALSTVQAVADLPRACPHFELPIQAGDDAILKRMARGYTVVQYRALIAHIRDLFPDQDGLPECSIATDVIVGFPGESEAQYEATYRLLQELRFDAVHVAAYSVRPGTPAAGLTDDVDQAEKERRRRAVDELQAQIIGEINARLMDRTVEVLVEEKRKGRWQGRTITNKLVFFEDETRDWRGRLARVRITWTGPWSMIGEVGV